VQVYVEAIEQGSVITKRYVNLRGDFDFTCKLANDSKFGLNRYKSLKIWSEMAVFGKNEYYYL